MVFVKVIYPNQLSNQTIHPKLIELIEPFKPIELMKPQTFIV